MPKQVNTLTKSGRPTATGAVNGSTSPSGNVTVAILCGQSPLRFSFRARLVLNWAVTGVAGGGVAIISIIVCFGVRYTRRNRYKNKESQPRYQYNEESTNRWKSPPSSHTYDPGISTGPAVIATMRERFVDVFRWSGDGGLNVGGF